MDQESPFASGYDPGRFFDEMFAEGGAVRPHYERLLEELVLTEDRVPAVECHA